MTRTKICGFTRAADVTAACAAGVDAIGLNVAKGPRKISPAQASALVRMCPPFVTTVLLTVDADVATCLNLLQTTRCSAIQLHGNEPPEVAAELQRRVPVFKAFSIANADDLELLHGYPADGFLLDAKVTGQSGGTGVVWDWSILKAAKFTMPIILAGGLNPDNVSKAIAATTPWAVDTASGVESAPGLKDSQRMAAFIRAAHAS